jgi:hypothetical protein
MPQGKLIVPQPPDCPYDLLARIGEGGCADVYSAIHPDRPFDPVAVKVQKPGPLGQERFRREIDIARRLDHPHVMPLILASARDAWYVMPLADETLRELHDRNPYDWEGLRVALSGICGGSMHTPTEWSIETSRPTTSSQPRVATDRTGYCPTSAWLAYAQPARSITPPGAMFVTPDFTAPEIHHDPRDATALSDAYSIGAIARWFTNIGREQVALSAEGRYWAELIQGTVIYTPQARWPITRIARHLETRPAVDRVLAGSASWEAPFCTRCGGRDGHDGAGRCTRCGFLDEI